MESQENVLVPKRKFYSLVASSAIIGFWMMGMEAFINTVHKSFTGRYLFYFNPKIKPIANYTSVDGFPYYALLAGIGAAGLNKKLGNRNPMDMTISEWRKAMLVSSVVGTGIEWGVGYIGERRDRESFGRYEGSLKYTAPKAALLWGLCGPALSAINLNLWRFLAGVGNNKPNIESMSEARQEEAFINGE